MAGQVLSAHRSMAELVDASILSEATKFLRTLPLFVTVVPRQQGATRVVAVMASLRSRAFSWTMLSRSGCSSNARQLLAPRDAA